MLLLHSFKQLDQLTAMLVSLFTSNHRGERHLLIITVVLWPAWSLKSRQSWELLNDLVLVGNMFIPDAESISLSKIRIFVILGSLGY